MHGPDFDWDLYQSSSLIRHAMTFIFFLVYHPGLFPDISSSETKQQPKTICPRASYLSLISPKEGHCCFPISTTKFGRKKEALKNVCDLTFSPPRPENGNGIENGENRVENTRTGSTFLFEKTILDICTLLWRAVMAKKSVITPTGGGWGVHKNSGIPNCFRFSVVHKIFSATDACFLFNAISPFFTTCWTLWGDLHCFKS